jgi:hypothetical protein
MSEDSFCAECGTAVERSAYPVRWEYCEIGWTRAQVEHSQGNQLYFWAEATGPKGTYDAGISPNANGQEPESGATDQRQAFDALIRQLVRDGWVPLPNNGPDWYSRKFRRQVRG